MHFTSFEEIENFMNRQNQKKTIIYNIEHIDPFLKKDEYIFNSQREHWKKLHTEIFDEKKFFDWVESIPGCLSCKNNFKEILKNNPPRFADWNRWSWEVHNIVNKKIGKPYISWDEACKIWSW